MSPSRVSRRGLLQAAGTGALTMWIPKSVGASVADGSAIGVSKWELDTPALCVDLDKLDQNIATLRSKLASTSVAIRPHAKTHKCPEVAKLQLAAGAIGICTAKVSEAEAMFAGGIDKILMTTSNVTKNKITRAMAIRQKNPNFIQAVDYAPNARDLSDAAKALGITADVVIDVAVGTRSGVPPEQALALAQMVDKLPNLKLRGMLSYDGSAQHIKGFKKRYDDTLKRIEPNVQVFEGFKKSGLNTEIFSGGGSGTYNIVTKVPGFTDVQAGSYIFMDAQYLEIGGMENEEVFTDFTPSLTVMATVLNAYFPNRLTTDAGAKALTLNQPPAIVIGEPSFKYNAGSDEFGTIQFEKANKQYRPGDKLELIVPHCDPAVNEYDVIHGTRKDKVEVVLAISARGHSQ